jgi:hypothetical protein
MKWSEEFFPNPKYGLTKQFIIFVAEKELTESREYLIIHLLFI